MDGIVEAIAIAKRRGELPEAVEAVTAVTGAGLDGEYHFDEAGAPGIGITLIAAEDLAGLRADTGIELDHAGSRRNVLTAGIDLNALVGRRFAVGAAECQGVELCEPCRGLERMTEPGVLRGLVHRGGLRADVVAGGAIRVGDPVRAL
jgi:MOSC domain-containing protein YiiM